MLQQRWFYVVVATVACILQAQGADKYTDENRPYEFGFNIDGEQHRHEKKDENGLIMGEFGFITADGVYHVTVYATDENGNFKILSMKNIRVKPFPTAPVKKGHSLPFPPSQNPPQTQGPSSPSQISSQTPGLSAQTPNAAPALSPAAPVKSCSHCSLPTTTTKRPQLTDIAVVSQDQGNSQFGGQAPGNAQYPQVAPNYSGGQQNYPSGQPNYPGATPNNPGGQANYPSQNVNGASSAGQQYPQGGPRQEYPQGGSGQSYPQEGTGGDYSQPGAGGQPNYPQGQKYPPQSPDGQQAYPQGGDGIQTPGQSLQTPLGNSAGDRNPKQITNYPNGPQGSNGPNGNDGPSKPTLISAQMQIVDKNTDIYHKNPGEKDGLPDGLTKDDMVRLLYTFNYTVGFHGHFEEGYTNGAKQGYYYVTGRNGVKTRVDYVADEKGFRPKITQEVLDLLSDDVPKPETEKDEKYGLKGYEFKWLYYPVDSSSR